jgi:hypothetical protein
MKNETTKLGLLVNRRTIKVGCGNGTGHFHAEPEETRDAIEPEETPTMLCHDWTHEKIQYANARNLQHNEDAYGQMRAQQMSHFGQSSQQCGHLR